jgi:5-methylcytosine-specific restriction endonuclease McrA
MNSITKKCSKCQKEISVDLFVTCTRNKSGIGSTCKACHNIENKDSREKYPDRWNNWYKVNKQRVDAQTKAYREKHPEVVKKSAKKYSATHAEQKAEYGKRYNAEHKEENHNRYLLNFTKYAIASKERYEKNKESIKQYYQEWLNKNREKKALKDSEYGKKYRKEHPEKSKEYDHRRRAKLKQVGGDGFTKEEWAQLKNDYNHLCAYCGKRKPLTIDHVVPIDRGGLHDISNMIPACKSCNSGKQAKPLLIYLLHRLKNGR